MYMAYIGTKLSTTIDISLRLGKAQTLSFLLVAVLIVFVWQQFTALLIGVPFSGSWLNHPLGSGQE
jgi:hypothetical protein